MESDIKKQMTGGLEMVPLLVLVFFTGWFIMQTEMVGARALTPYFGNSIFVWGSVIAVFLLAMAIGYYIGGRLTRKWSSHWVPAALLIGAGALVGVSVLYQDSLCYAMVNSGTDVRWGALLGSTLLYALPMVLAGTVSPYAVHIAAGTRAEVGRRAGGLYAVSTVGSFIGSLVTSFMLIPAYSLQQVTIGGGVIAAVAAVTAALALTYPGRLAAAASFGIAVLLVLATTYSPRAIVSSRDLVYNRSLIGVTLSDDAPSTLGLRLAAGQREADAELQTHSGAAGEKVLFNRETAYNHVEVTQIGEIRLLTFGQAGLKMPQTMMNLRNIKAHPSEYTGNLLAPLLYKADVKRVLIVGLGGGDVARAVETCFPDVVMDVVEIDPAVVRAAQEFFFWKPSRNVTVFTMDGRSFLNMAIMTHREAYDWVLLDAFGDDFAPFHMNTREFYSIVQRVLVPGGVLAVNTHLDHDLYSYQARTLQSVFEQVDAYMSHRGGNVILAAQEGATQPMTPDRALAARKATRLAPGAAVDLKYITTCLLSQPNWDPEGEIFTDTWAPVESLMSLQ